MSKSNVVLFDATSPALDSPVFQLNNQITVIATGLPAGDYITFEIIRLAAGDPARLCGCRLSEATNATIDLTQPLTCAVCGPEDNQQLVRLTENNSTIILDAPQGALLRAIYHGVGVDQQVVNVWYNETNTHTVTDAMRGCAPEETWAATGTERCEGSNVERQELSSCGATRWVVDRPLSWTETGLRRCNTTTGNFEIQEVSDCGAFRWTVAGAFTWQPTGETSCVEATLTVRTQEVSPCGDIRWVDTVLTEAEFWTNTGEMSCEWRAQDATDDAYTVSHQQVSPCGGLRWLPEATTRVGVPDPAALCYGTTIAVNLISLCGSTHTVVVTEDYPLAPTGKTRCVTEDRGGTPTDVMYIEMSNFCGETSWVEDTSGLPVYYETSELRCDTANNTVSRVLKSRCCDCSDRVEVVTDPSSGDPITIEWVSSGLYQCDAESNTVIVEEHNQCGQVRWTTVTESTEGGDVPVTITWVSTGLFSCDAGSNTVMQEERNQCGQVRWTVVTEPSEGGDVPVGVEWMATGLFNCDSASNTVTAEERNQCGQIRWTTCGTIEWRPTGNTRVLAGESMLEEINTCGVTRWTPIPNVTWTLTGVQACVGGYWHNQETDGYGNVRVVATTDPCGPDNDCEEIVHTVFDTGWVMYTARRKSGYVQSLWTFPHGLVQQPNFVTMEFRCEVAEGFYAPGDIIEGNPHAADVKSSAATGYAIKTDAANIFLSVDRNNGISLHQWNGKGNFMLSNNKWMFRIRGYI